MKPVDQTTFGFPGGNCFSACIASILEIPLEDVPYFMGDTLDDDQWFERLSEWLRPWGLYAVCFKLSDDGWVPEGIHVLSGQSPRKPDEPMSFHSVVAQGTKILHDPHGTRAGLLSRYDVLILLPLDLAEWGWLTI